MREVGGDEPHDRRCISSGGSRETGQHRERLEPGVAGKSELAFMQRLPRCGVGVVVGEDQWDRGAGVEQNVGSTGHPGPPD